jgi:alpha-L-arabinofuranosidase
LKMNIKKIRTIIVGTLVFLTLLVLNACKNDVIEKPLVTSTPSHAHETVLEPPAAIESLSEPLKLTVHAATPGINTSPVLYGGFFEEINHAGDGGLYAEMIANRSFEETPNYPDQWVVVNGGKGKGQIALNTKELINKVQGHSLALTITSADSQNTVGISNRGYWGINLVKGSVYKLSFYAKSGVKFQGGLNIRIETSNGKSVLAEDNLQKLGDDWQQYKFTFNAKETSNDARLMISSTSVGTVYFDMVSLFPEATWKQQPNGLRADLAEMVDAISPKFMRFPGGCFVEGDSLANAYHWKETIGDIASRPGHWGIWQYRSTDGLGFHEFLKWSEDLGAEPLYVINVGISHKFGNVMDTEMVPLAELQPWIQDALDAIEYANGPATSKWGAKRVANGHPKPFNLKYLEIGNENNFQMSDYAQRYPLFYKAINAKYPDIQLIANAVVPGQTVDYIDEHYYESPNWFMANANRYDSYDRNGPKIYVGEYAVTKGAGKGNMDAALGEAAFLTGVERNSDIVKMASYAPLFVNDNDRRWNPDAIVFNNEKVYGTPSYYVQQLFGRNKGDMILPTTLSGGNHEKPTPIIGAIGLGSWASQVEYKDVNVVSGGKTLFADDFSQETSDWKPMKGSWTTNNGVYVQSSSDTEVRSVVGDPNWSNYTLTLKAQKTGGAEGMLIIFGAKDTDNYYWWNLGGWGNSKHALEKATNGQRSVIGQDSPGHIESNRWYDIKIEVEGNRIRCYLDGDLVQEVEENLHPGPLFLVAGKDKATSDYIVKVVNVSDKEQKGQIVFDGWNGGKLSGEVTELTSDHLDDENSFDNMTKIKPQTHSITGLDASFDYTFSKYSVTVLRLKPEK